MIKIGFFDIIIIITLFQLAVFIIFLLSPDRFKYVANRFMALFLTAQFLVIFNTFLRLQNPFFSTHCPFLFFIGYPFLFIWAPTIYFYVRSLTTTDFSFTKHQLIHFIPFFLMCLFVLFYYHVQGWEAKQQILESGIFSVRWFSLLISGLVNLQLLFYLIAALIILHRFRKRLKNQFSSLDKVSLDWLTTLLYVYWFVYLFNVAKNITYIHSYSLSNLLFIFTHIVILVFLNLIFFKGWSQPALFSKIFEKEKKIKYKGSPLTDELKEFYLKEIEQYMDAEKPYLDFSISLGQLSEKTKISTNYLSQVINELLKKNFFDFINEYRINDAKMMLASPKYQNDSIQEILYRVGFNSKSTFYTIFKKNTGMTPTAFRKKSRLKQN